MVDMSTHTPSGDEVEIVSADQWQDMSITELFDQRIILNNRFQLAAQYGNPNMLKQIQMGINKIDTILRFKENSNKKKKINKRKQDITGLI